MSKTIKWAVETYSTTIPLQMTTDEEQQYQDAKIWWLCDEGFQRPSLRFSKELSRGEISISEEILRLITK